MAEGKALGKEDLFVNGLFDDAKRGATELLAVIKETQDTIRGSISAQKEFVSTFKAKSYDDVKQLNQAMAETNQLIKQQEQLTKAELVVAQQAEKLNQQKLKTQQEEIKTASLAEKQNRATERSLNSLNGEYTKGVKQLAEIKKQLKELEFTGRNNGKLYKQLGKEFEELDKKVRKAEEGVGEFQRNVGNYPNAVKELKALNREMQNMEVGTAEFEKAAKKAGALRDQIKDAKEATAVFANESKTAQASTAFGQMLGSIKDLDFKDAADKAKVFSSVISSISLTEVVSGLKNLGVALLNVGKALLFNPLTLLAAAVAAVVYVVYDLIEANRQLDAGLEENRKTIEANNESYKKYANAHAEYVVKMAVALGKLSKAQGELKLSELKNNNERIDLAKKFAEQKIKLAKDLEVDITQLENGRANESYTGDYKQMQRNIAFNKGIIDLEKSQALERKGLLQSQQDEINLMKQENDNEEKAKKKEQLEKEKKENDAALKRIKEHEAAVYKARAAARKKEFDDLWKQVQKDTEDLNNYITEQQVKSIDNEVERKKAEAKRIYDLKVKEIENSKALEETKAAALIEAARRLKKALEDIDKEADDNKDKADAKRQEKRAKAAQKDFKEKWDDYQKDVDKQKKATQEQIAQLDKLEKAVEAGFQKRNKIANDYLDRETQANQKAIEAQERLAERGLDNTLAFEKEKAAKLELEKRRQQEKEVRQQKIFAFYQLFSSYAKTDPNTALQKAIVDTALAEVISGAFIEGTENVGRDLQGNKVHNGTDGYVVAVDGNERIFNPSQNAKIGNISNEDAAQILHDYQKGVLFNYGNIEQPKGVLINQNIELRETNNLLKQLLSVTNNKPVHQTNIDNLGNIVHAEIRNGIAKVTTHRRRI
jgi:hypothetical protein